MLVILALVVVLVAIDALARLDERRLPPIDETLITTQEIIVDLTKRR